MDNRYQRDARELKSNNKANFGEAQIDWLINALARPARPRLKL